MRVAPRCRAGRSIFRPTAISALLPAAFLERFGRLADWEQLMLLASLQRVAGLFEEGEQPASILMDDEPLV